MTGEDRTVQVPVSVIETAADALALMGEMADSNFLRALLSQPNPTAEPQCTCFPVPEHLHTTHYGATDPATTLEPNPECPLHFPSAESPRIEDMAPGTRAAIERADLVLGGFVQHDWSSSTSVHEWYRSELRKLRDAIDPSTIRDVTPPAVAP